MYYVFIILVTVLVFFASVCHCDKKPVFHEPSKQVFEPGTSLPENALFGYGISYQSLRQKIIISAPRADQGEVFECNVSENVCSKVNIKLGMDSKPATHFWLGAAVCAGSDFFLTCAPRYSEKSYLTEYTDSASEQVTIVHTSIASKCFYQNATTGKINIENPISLDDSEKIISNKLFFNDSVKSSILAYRFDTLGWSMDVSSDDVTIVGGPGAVMGRAMLIPKYDKTAPQLIHLMRNDSNLEGRVLYEFGYSVKAGKFLGSEVFAISSPYGAMGRGKVLLYSKAREYLQAIVDDDIGAIFGGALCNARLGAGDEALLVGAPASALGSLYEIDVGAVHVYLNEAGKMRRKRTIRGYKNNGYFGYAIASVGDVNLDGKDEVVISAPYENEYRGAVYIFSGADLVKDATAPMQWLQRVEGSAPAQLLGLSLSVVQDLDGNGCNELTIGLPGNNSAVLMKCITFINFTIDFKEDKANYKEIDKSTLVFINMCVNITYKEKLKHIDNNLTVIIKLKHPNATLYNSVNNTVIHYVTLAGAKSYCRSLLVILPLNGNYDNNTVVQVNASLTGQDVKDSTEFNRGLVMLTDETQTYLERTLPIKGSNLSMHLYTSFNNTTDYIIGSTKSEQLTIVVKNAASSPGGAYAACVRTRILGVGIASAAPNSSHCASAGDTITCMPSKPIFAGESAVSIINLDTKSLTGEASAIEIEAKLFNPCGGSNSSSKSRMSFTLLQDFNVTIAGESNPSSSLNVSQEELVYGYEDISHVYSIINAGVTSWRDVNCTIIVPQYVNYTVSADHGGKCELNHSKDVVTCVLNKLYGKKERDIIISMDVLPNTEFTGKVLEGKAELVTEITCMVAGEQKSKRITTTLNLLHTTVPLGILIAAVSVGILALLVVIFVLYKYDCLRRKHKEELGALKREVRRQSIRRSIRLRESMTEESKDQLESNKEEDETERCVFMDVTEPSRD